MLQEVINNHLPSSWEKSHYSKSFVKFPIGLEDDEYIEVVLSFKNLTVTRVERIQNPFIWGRFKLRKEQLSRKTTIHEHIMYHPISLKDVDIVAEYNCDYRRYSPTANSSQHSGKTPKFYQTPQSAKDRYQAYSTELPVIVVVRVLHPNMNVNSLETKDWESEYAPEYIVNLS